MITAKLLIHLGRRNISNDEVFFLDILEGPNGNVSGKCSL